MFNIFKKGTSRGLRTFDKLESIQLLEKRLDDQKIKEACLTIPIVVIDNEPIGRMERSLVASGFKTVKALRKIDSIGDVAYYQIILIDIHGVGKKLANGGDSLPYEGLSVAEEIKRQYPMKKVLIFSAALSDYKDNYILRDIVDGSFPKDGNVVERNKIITDQVEALINPRRRWMEIRSRLMNLDVPLREIAVLEDYFVETIRENSGKWDVDQASRIIGNVKDAIAIIKDAFDIGVTVANTIS